jgi:FMN phosphatase YigB (HAD superfamily)
MRGLNVPTFNLNLPPKVITIDCYGTLVHWYEASLRKIKAVLVARGRGDYDPQAVLGAFRDTLALSEP